MKRFSSFKTLNVICNMNCTLSLSLVDQHLLQWRPASVWSCVGGLPPGWWTLGGNTGSVLHRVFPGSHCSGGVGHFHHLLPHHGTTWAGASNSNPVIVCLLLAISLLLTNTDSMRQYRLYIYKRQFRINWQQHMQTNKELWVIVIVSNSSA